MDLNNKDQIRIREYLLGRLPENEHEMLEERLLVEEDLFLEFEISKGEVVEEYYSASLSEEESRYLEQNLLASNEGRQRYELVLTLDKLKPREVEDRGPALFDRFQTFFRQRFQLVATVTAAAVVLIVVAVWLSRSNGQIVDGPTLASNLINRQQGSLPTKVSIPAKASAMKFRLLLPSDMPADAEYRAALDNRIEIRPVDVVTRDQAGVIVVIPVNQLKRGEYSLKVVAHGSDGKERAVPGYYLFNVE